MDLITLKAAVHHFGKDYQCDIAIEEMAELTKALLKNRRYPSPKMEHDVIEEMADVSIMLEQVKIMFDVDSKLLAEYDELQLSLQKWFKHKEKEQIINFFIKQMSQLTVSILHNRTSNFDHKNVAVQQTALSLIIVIEQLKKVFLNIPEKHRLFDNFVKDKVIRLGHTIASEKHLSQIIKEMDKV